MIWNKKYKIITHNGSFHADDIFACAVLSLYLKNRVKIIRARDKSIIEKGDYVVDVGGINEEQTNRFDHHQIGGAGKRDNGIPYASFGLVWRKFGPELCDSIEASSLIDQKIVQPIDAEDNGVDILKPLIKGIYPYKFNEIKSAFLPTWKEDNSEIDDSFLKLVNFAAEILKREIIKANDEIEGEKIIEESYQKAADKRLVILDQMFGRHFVTVSFIKHKDVLFAVFPGGDSHRTWNVIAMREDMAFFKYRKLLPEAWAGQRDEEFAKISGVPDALFCHNDRFLAVAKSKVGAIRLAELALKA